MSRPCTLRALVVPLGIVCSVSHLVLAPVHGVDVPVLGFLTVATAVFCLFHLGRLWRAPSRAGWGWSASLGAIMTVHGPSLALLQAPPTTLAGRSFLVHDHQVSTDGAGAWFDTLATVATAAGALQTGLCLLALVAAGCPGTTEADATDPQRVFAIGEPQPYVLVKTPAAGAQERRRPKKNQDRPRSQDR